MPKLEKDRTMPAVREIKTLWKEQAKNLEKLNIDPDTEVTIRVFEDNSTENKVTLEQQRLLDMVDNTIMTKTKIDTTELIRAERQSKDGNNADGFPLDNKNK